ncbi:MAG: 4'-phosphopantetheinyl transferase superfamily protein [Bacteroidetes bacterium]|nr:4'-phosphopantetheinyl transferase superfamily protein [Bacteroidota bacterium]
MFLTHDMIELVYDEKGKPHINGIEGNISISHTGNYVTIIYHKTQPTGIDIERINPRIEKIAFKFLNDHERQFAQGENYLEKLYVIWGAKESIFKWHGKGDMDFKTNFNVLPFHFNGKGMITAQFILNKDIRELKLHYHRFDDVMLVHLVSD